MSPTPPADRLQRLERLLLREVDYQRKRVPRWAGSSPALRRTRWPLTNADPYQTLRNVITGDRRETWYLEHGPVLRSSYTDAEIREVVQRVLLALRLEDA